MNDHKRRIPIHDHSNFNQGGFISSTVQQIVGSSTTSGEASSISASNSVTSETTLGLSASAGSSSTYSRGDHTHGSPTGSSIGALGFVGPLLIADVHSTPIVFGDLIVNEATDDFLYADV
jgi:hypothetical protein